MLLLNKNVNLNKNEAQSKIGNPTYTFRKMNLCASAPTKNHELKVKLW